MSEALSIGSTVNLTIHDFAVGGEAVGRVDNFVLFIPGGAPGDEIQAQITELRKNFGRARISKIIKPSVHRIQPRCPIYHDCGGCQLQHIDYDSQLQVKTKMVADAIQHLAGLSDVKVNPCHKMKSPWNYRCKVQTVTGAKPYLTREGEEPRFRPFVGFYTRGTHSIVKVDDCCIQDVNNNKVISAAREALERLQWPIYNNEDGSGCIRYIIARTGKNSGKTLLVIVSSQPRLPHVREFVDMMRKRCPSLQGVVLNLNPHHTNVIMGSRSEVLWGSDHIIETVCGLNFHVSAASFFQVNMEGLEEIYKALSKYLFDDKKKEHNKKKETVLDAYCGVGSLALFAAQNAKRVVGIDQCQAAIEDAVVNSDLNNFNNTDFMDGTVERILPKLYQKGTRFSSAILDPPRKGCDPVVLETIAKMRIPKLVYVSCNPSTLARDLGILAEKGYKALEVQPIDMFPQTYHVESVAHIVRK
ncbi:MAG: 23S rRNA (uracil(1939)-C(5))-methyltransferase RlmD [bacterium]|nr:23S rRNA (uracil(1939)-C(5))-methyltransferase RlmD [bacterium]